MRRKLDPITIAILFGAYKIRFVGSMRDTVYLEPAFGVERPVKAGRMWYVSDNGGEWNVGPVNHDDEMRSIAYEDRGSTLDAGTMAYRIAMVVKGEGIDWEARWPEFIKDFAARGQA